MSHFTCRNAILFPALLAGLYLFLSGCGGGGGGGGSSDGNSSGGVSSTRTEFDISGIVVPETQRQGALKPATIDTGSSPEFVAEEVIIRFKHSIAPESYLRRADADSPLSDIHPVNGNWGEHLQHMRMDYRGMARVPARILEKFAQHGNANIHHRTLAMIEWLESQPGVEWAEPNYIRHANAISVNDPLFEDQWHLPLINVPSAWMNTTGEASVVVAIPDTGILSDHPDLQGQLVPGYDFIDDDADPGDRGNRAESSFHGTHVAGIVAAAGNNGTGIAGIAYETKIMPLRVLNSSDSESIPSGNDADIIQAIRFAAGLSNASRRLPSQRADIINLSLGGCSGLPNNLRDAINDARAEGVIVVAAAGNEPCLEPGQAFYPASLPTVVGVGSIDQTRAPSSFSNAGQAANVWAPGGKSSRGKGILSTGINTATEDFGYTYSQGTSMASATVSGIAALMKSLNPGLSPNGLDWLLATGQLTRPGLSGTKVIDAERSTRPLGTRIRVELINAATSQVEQQVTASESNTFRFSRVPSGNWILRAGLDTNDDGRICNSDDQASDDQEPCAGPIEVTVNGDLDNITLTVGTP